jgi:hypothetical protein
VNIILYLVRVPYVEKIPDTVAVMAAHILTSVYALTVAAVMKKSIMLDHDDFTNNKNNY